MAALSLKSPFGPVFNQAGAAGPRRLLTIGAIIVVAFGAVAVAALHNNKVPVTTSIAKVPAADPLPGGPHTNQVYSDLAKRADQEAATKAAAVGASSVATMPGNETAVPVSRPAASYAPPSTHAVDPATLASRPPPYLPSVVAAPVVQNVVAQTHPDDNQTKAYQAAISSLFAGWGGKPQLTEVILAPDDKPATGRTGAVADPLDQRASASPDSAPQKPIANARRLGGRGEGGTVLMPAGRGVYARTVSAASSDQGGPVVIEALSGPIAGDRMTGSFQQRDNRLVVRLDSITLQDGTQQRIDALVTAPDSLETSVASSVDQHILTRFVLPVAAAFVSGLGQAISQSNSTVVAGPLGGATAFQNLNIDQQLGVAAGAAANQFGAAVQAATPRGPTVKLDANVDVGVFFLSPLIIRGDR